MSFLPSQSKFCCRRRHKTTVFCYTRGGAADKQCMSCDLFVAGKYICLLNFLRIFFNNWRVHSHLWTQQNKKGVHGLTIETPQSDMVGWLASFMASSEQLPTLQLWKRLTKKPKFDYKQTFPIGVISNAVGTNNSRNNLFQMKFNASISFPFLIQMLSLLNVLIWKKTVNSQRQNKYVNQFWALRKKNAETGAISNTFIGEQRGRTLLGT